MKKSKMGNLGVQRKSFTYSSRRKLHNSIQSNRTPEISEVQMDGIITKDKLEIVERKSQRQENAKQINENGNTEREPMDDMQQIMFMLLFCLSYDIFGNKISSESNSKNHNATETDESLISCIRINSKSIKRVKLCNRHFEALIDTGSDINAIQKSVFDSLGIPYKTGCNQKLKTAGNSSIGVNNYFYETITIDGELFQTVFYVLNDEDIPIGMIIGNELLFSPEVRLIINSGHMAIERISNGPWTDANSSQQHSELHSRSMMNRGRRNLYRKMSRNSNMYKR